MIFIIGLILFLSLRVSGALEKNSRADADFNPGPAIHEVSGEIVAINDQNVALEIDGVVFQLKYAPRPRIYCNGKVAIWKALLPVAAGAFFEGRAVLNSKNEVLIIEGYYYGKECIVRSCFHRSEHSYLELVSVEDQRMLKAELKEGARLPLGNWCNPGQLIFAVFNRAGQVRAVYLPD